MSDCWADMATSTASSLSTHITLAHVRGIAARSSCPETLVFHALVDAGDIIAVAVEKEGRPALARADDLFARLTPARMRHLRIDVRPKAVLCGLQCFPHALRTLVGEAE